MSVTNKMASSSGTRIHYFDALRVFCAFLIVYLHTTAIVMGDYENSREISWIFVVITNSFTRMGVTIFFMISGALLLRSSKNDSISYVLKHRVLKIFIQVIVWSIIYLLFHTFIWQTKDFNVIKYIRLITSSGIHSNLWFLHVLLGLYIILPLLRIIVSKVNVKYLWYLFILCFLEVYVRYGLKILFKLEFEATLPIATGFIGAFILGYLLNETNINKRNRRILYIIGLLSFVLNVYMTFKLSSQAGSSNRSWLNSDNMTILFQSSAFFVMFKYSSIFNKISENSIIKKISSLTFGIYIIHSIVVFSIIKWFEITTSQLTVPYLLIIYIVVCLITLPITLILYKTPYLKYLVT